MPDSVSFLHGFVGERKNTIFAFEFLKKNYFTKAKNLILWKINH